MLDHWGSCNPSKISWTIWLPYGDRLYLHLSHNKYFWLFHSGITVQFKLAKHKFLNETTLPVHLCGFEITHGKKQCRTCQHTNYHNTTNHIWFLCGGWKNVIQGCFTEVTLPAYRYAHLHTFTCYEHTFRGNISTGQQQSRSLVDNIMYVHPTLQFDYDYNQHCRPQPTQLFFPWVELLLSCDIVKLVTIVERNPKAPFSIATIQRYRKGCYSFPRIAPLYPWYVLYNAEC